MKKFLLIIPVLFILVGCSNISANTPSKYEEQAYSDFEVFLHCNDGVVCYFKNDGAYRGRAGGCFLNEETLLSKYCN